MRRFLRLLGNLGVAILTFIGYAWIQGLYMLPAKTKINFEIGAVIAIVTVLGIFIMFTLYRWQLKSQNDWQFNEKPHWDAKRIFIAIGMFILLIIFQLSFIKLFGNNTTSANQASLEEIQSNAGPIFNLLIVIVAPICEEIIFRGMFFNIIFVEENFWNKLFGIIASGFLFAYVHDPHMSKFIILYWIMGSILAWTYLSTKDLRYSILAHMLNNLMGIL